MSIEYFIQLLHNIHSSQQPIEPFQNQSYLRDKARLSKYKKIEIIPCVLSDHNALKLELNNKNNGKKHASNWKLNKTLLNDQWVDDQWVDDQ
jgi:hypothetical protein